MNVREVLGDIADAARNGDIVFPTSTDVVLRIRRVLDDPNSDTDTLAHLVESEPMLSAQVVGIANSVAYNPHGNSISDVRHALPRIGFKTLRSLATAMIVRQMRDMPGNPEHRAMAARLWEHTAHVAALARTIARRFSHQDPEAAFFAGIIHEMGGFYLISRLEKYPGLLDADLEPWHGEGEAQIGREILGALNIPENIMAAMETLWDGYLSMPARSLGDTLLLADQLAPVESPLSALAGIGTKGIPADIDMMMDETLLSEVLAESAEEVHSLIAVLHS